MVGNFKSAFNNVRIHHKMIILISGLMIASFSVYLIVLNSVYDAYDEQVYQKSSEVLSMSSLGIENKLKELEDLSFAVVSDEQIQRYLYQLELPETSDYEKMTIRKKITNRIIAFAGSETYVYSMMVIDKDQNVMVAGNREGIPESLQNDLIALARLNNGSNGWMLGGRGFSLLGAREIKSYTGTTFTLESLGTLVFRVRIDRIVDDQVRDSNNGGQLIISDGREILYPQEPELTGTEIAEQLRNEKPYSVNSYENGRFFTARVHSSYNDWDYLYITPYDRLFEHITSLKNAVNVIFILLFIAGILFGAKLSSGITRPIERLIKKMREIEKGDLDKLEEQALGAVPSSPQVEVGLLHRTFTMMIRRIRELINENYAKQLVIRETELKALQAQINPHFLYNTLESINWMAKSNKQPQISEMAEALGFLLRHSVSFKEPLITLKQELDIVQSYVTIQKTRFEERLVFSMDVPKELEDVLIPRLTLQPLVENAIHYALEPSIEPCHIHIRVSEQQGKMVVSVEDDGPGMPAGLLEDIRLGRATTRGQGIGLTNIEERIQLTFGHGGGLRIESIPHSKTSVHVTVPLTRGEYQDV